MRVMDIILAFPVLLLALVLVAILGPGLTNAMIAIALVLQPHFVRLTRAAVMGEKDQGLCHRGAGSPGAGPLRLMFRTILPNCMAPLIVQATLSFSNAILDAAALGFLGMGAQPPTPEWGTMLAEAREFILRAWWVVTFPGLAILITVLAINLMGDGLRDALDPQAEAELTDGAPRDREPHRRIRDRVRLLPRGRRRVAQSVDKGEVLAIVGESRLRQVGGHAGRDGPSALDREGHRRPADLRRPRPAAASTRERAPQDHRQGHRDDLPGADVEPQPLLHRRLPDRWKRCRPTSTWTRRSARARAIELLQLVGIPDAGASGCRPSRTSFRAA